MKEFFHEAWNVEPPKGGPSIAELACMGCKHGPPHMKKYMICQVVISVILFIVYYQWNGGECQTLKDGAPIRSYASILCIHKLFVLI